MNLAEAPFPARPVKVRPPGTGIFSQLSGLLWAGLVGAGALGVVIPPVGDLVGDFQIRDAARPVPWARLEHGSCSTRLFLASCEAEMVARPPGKPELRRKVNYLFFDAHVGGYRVAVVVDPARPERLTTDLGLAKLWNRTITLAVLGPFFLALGALLLLAPLLLAPGTFRENRRMARVLSGGNLRAAALRLVRLERGAWTVAPHPAGAPGQERRWPMKGFPIVLDPGQGLVLGVTAGDGSVAVPLDARLGFLALTAEERRRLLAWIGPERIAWRPPGHVDRPRLRRFQRAATPLLVIGLVLGAAAGAMAWRGQAPAGGGEFERVDLENHAGSHTARVHIDGVLQNQLRVQSIWTDAAASHLEEYRPMTRTGWRPAEPVEWLVKEVSVAAPVPERTSRRGTVLAGEVPADARAAFARAGVTLSPRVVVLEPALPAEGSGDWGVGAILCAVMGAAFALVALFGYLLRWRLGAA